MSLDETTLIHLGNLLGQDGVVFQLQDVSHQPSQELGKYKCFNPGGYGWHLTGFITVVHLLYY